MLTGSRLSTVVLNLSWDHQVIFKLHHRCQFLIFVLIVITLLYFTLRIVEILLPFNSKSEDGVKKKKGEEGNLLKNKIETRMNNRNNEPGNELHLRWYVRYTHPWLKFWIFLVLLRLPYTGQTATRYNLSFATGIKFYSV